MALLDWVFGEERGAKKKAAALVESKPKEIILRFVGQGQVVWYQDDSQTLLKEGYLKNHVVFSIVDWIASKITVAPPILYEVKDEKQLRRYKSLLKDPTRDSVLRALDIRRKALEEIEDSPMMDLFKSPNP